MAKLSSVPLLLVHLIISHWPKQVTWLYQQLRHRLVYITVSRRKCKSHGNGHEDVEGIKNYDQQLDSLES